MTRSPTRADESIVMVSERTISSRTHFGIWPDGTAAGRYTFEVVPTGAPASSLVR